MHRFVFAACVLTAAAHGGAPAAAEDASPLKAIYACAALADDAARLACFDAEVAAVKSAETAGELVAVDREKVRQIEREGFGFNLPSLPKLGLPSLGGVSGGADADEIESIDVAIERIDKRADGRLSFRLSDGSVWSQVDSDKHRISGKPPKRGQIKRATLGSFLLSIDGYGRAIRVRRES